MVGATVQARKAQADIQLVGDKLRVTSRWRILVTMAPA